MRILPPEPPLEHLQVRNGLLARHDLRGHEDGKAGRPYLALSDVDVHRNGLIVACLVTHAEGRTERSLLREIEVLPSTVLDGKKHYLDLQQFWTLPTERDAAGADTVGRLAAPALEARTLRWLSELINGARRERAEAGAPSAREPVPGQVVWLDLLGDAGDPQTDRFAIYRALEGLGHRWLAEETTLIPCMVLLSAAAKRVKTPAILQLITTVPLLHLPDFQKTHDEEPNPTIAVPGEMSGGVAKQLSALTQLVVTVDYRQHLGWSGQRVFFSEGSLATWLAEPSEFETIVSEIETIWGLE